MTVASAVRHPSVCTQSIPFQQPFSNAQRIFVTRLSDLHDLAQQTVRASGLKCGNYTVRIADSLEPANKLIKRMYAARGYRTGKAVTVRSNPNRITLEACAGEKTVGTLTVGLDSDEGLLADALYGDIIDPFRGIGRKVCELSQFAVDSHHSSKELLASLFRLAYICGRVIHQAADAFIEVNPRHVRFYEHTFGFRQVGELRTCPRVGAPAVLLHIDLDYMDAQLGEPSGLLHSRERTLYSVLLTVRDRKSPAEFAEPPLAKTSSTKSPAEAGLRIRQTQSGELVIS